MCRKNKSKKQKLTKCKNSVCGGADCKSLVLQSNENTTCKTDCKQENKPVLKKQKSAEGFILNGLVSFALACIVFVVTLMCGFVGGQEVVSTFKSYNGVIYKGSETNNKVALMINVYWGTEHLEKMLEVLEKHNVKATFFVGKLWAKDNQELLKQMYQLGHEIGNHGTNHKEHGRLGYDDNVKEIQECAEFVDGLLETKMTLFAPPGGSYNKQTISACSELGYKAIMWTHDTIDWRDSDKNLILSRATSEVSSGDLILMHPTASTSEVFEQIIETIKSKNLTLATVSETLKDF